MVRRFFFSAGCLLFGLLFATLLNAQEVSQTAPENKKPVFFRNENNTCLRCHANYHYEFPNSDSSRVIRKELCSNYVIDTTLFYSSNHKTFKCTDCHSEDFSTYPHNASLKAEQNYACMDCHAGDEAYSKYHFEEINTHFENSIHYKADKDAFTCWQCHDPHTYKTNARVSHNVTKTVLYDNNICLGCHANINRMEVLTTKDKTNIVEKHDWLPNQELHFKNVRCVECHARQNDTLLVSHKILPKSKAVHLCAECHSQNSLLMASLYKYKVKQNRQQFGFINSVILNESFVIGANRNYYLNVISIALAIITLSGIIIHLLLRIFKR